MEGPFTKRQSPKIIYKYIASVYHIYRIEADNYSRTEVNLKVLVNILRTKYICQVRYHYLLKYISVRIENHQPAHWWIDNSFYTCITYTAPAWGSLSLYDHLLPTFLVFASQWKLKYWNFPTAEYSGPDEDLKLQASAQIFSVKDNIL